MPAENCHQYEIIAIDSVLKSMVIQIFILDGLLIQNVAFLCLFTCLRSLLASFSFKYFRFFEFCISLWLFIFLQFGISILEPQILLLCRFFLTLWLRIDVICRVFFVDVVFLHVIFVRNRACGRSKGFIKRFIIVDFYIS